MTGSSRSQHSEIAGYDYGSPRCAKSPVSGGELLELEQTLEWTANDAQLLRKHASLFEAQAEKMVDSWRAVIGAQPHLAKWFLAPNGKPDDQYKAAVKKRFVQWVNDVATRPHDQAWLDYQEEIGLRHTPDKKNKTDGRQTPPLVPLRYLLAFVPLVVGSFRHFFEGSITDRIELDAAERAWTKAVHLHVTLWTRPYSRDGLW
jgi:Protoglobin